MLVLWCRCCGGCCCDGVVVMVLLKWFFCGGVVDFVMDKKETVTATYS